MAKKPKSGAAAVVEVDPSELQGTVEVDPSELGGTTAPARTPGYFERHPIQRETLLGAMGAALPETDTPVQDLGKGILNLAKPDSIYDAMLGPMLPIKNITKGGLNLVKEIGTDIYHGAGSPSFHPTFKDGEFNLNPSLNEMDPSQIAHGAAKGAATAGLLYGGEEAAGKRPGPVVESPTLRTGAKVLTNPVSRGLGRAIRDFDLFHPFKSVADITAGPATEAAGEFLKKGDESAAARAEAARPRPGIGRVPVADRITPPPTEVPPIEIKPDAPYTPRTPKAKTTPAPVDRRPVADIAAEIAPEVEASASASADKLIELMRQEHEKPIPPGAPGSPAVEPLTPIKINSRVFHGTPTDRVPHILKEGLDTGWDAEGPGPFLTTDRSVASQYGDVLAVDIPPEELRKGTEPLPLDSEEGEGGEIDMQGHRVPPEYISRSKPVDSSPQLVGGTQRTGYTTEGQGGANYTPDQLAELKARNGIGDGPIEMVGADKPPVLFHGTSLDNLPSIAKEGLDPSKSTSMSLGDKGEWEPEPYTFLSESEPGATDYARGVTLRVAPSPEIAASLRTDLGEFTRAPERIPPDQISVERFPRIKGPAEVLDDQALLQQMREQMDAEQAALEEEQRAEWYRRNKPGKPKSQLIDDIMKGGPQ